MTIDGPLKKITPLIKGSTMNFKMWAPSMQEE